MKAISLLNIVPIAVGLGACTDRAAPGELRRASEIGVDARATQVDAPPDQVRIRSLSWAGSGCPAGTVGGNLASDFKAFTLLFDAYVAEIGPGLPLSQSRRNCQILIDLEFPQGWSYAVFDVDYRGFVSVAPSVSGVQQSSYYFQGEFRTARLHTTLAGPRVGDYQIRDSLGLDTTVWSPCGANRALIINSEVRLLNNGSDPDAQGLITTDSIDGKVTHIYGLQWQRCSP